MAIGECIICWQFDDRYSYGEHEKKSNPRYHICYSCIGYYFDRDDDELCDRISHNLKNDEEFNIIGHNNCYFCENYKIGFSGVPLCSHCIDKMKSTINPYEIQLTMIKDEFDYETLFYCLMAQLSHGKQVILYSNKYKKTYDISSKELEWSYCDYDYFWLKISTLQKLNDLMHCSSNPIKIIEENDDIIVQFTFSGN
jgi:hypothetical protein